MALSSLAVHAGAASRPDGITVSSVDGRSASEWYVGAFATIDYYLAKAPRGRFHPERLVWTEAYYLLNKAKYHDPDAARLHVAAPVLNPAPVPLPGEDTYRTWGRKELARALVAESAGDFHYSDVKLLSGLGLSKLAHMLAELRKANAEFVRAQA